MLAFDPKMKWMQCNSSVIPTLYVSNQKCLQQSPHALPLQDHMQRIVRRNDPGMLVHKRQNDI